MHPTIIGNPIFEGSQEPFQGQEHPQVLEERQIGVDPFSLRQFSQLNIDKPLPIPSVSVKALVPDMPTLPPLQPPRFGSASLPCSAATSPRLSPSIPPKGPMPATKWNAHPATLRSLASEHSSALARFGTLSRSKSCAEGQSELPADEFDVILSSSERKPSAPQRWGSNVPLIEAAGADDSSNYVMDAKGRKGRHKAKHGEAFKCCMYLPGLTRRSKPVQPSSTFRTTESDPGPTRPSTVSQTASLERFACGSWSTSSGIVLDGEGSSYFDLPLELIQSCDNETDLPVRTAFMFDSDGIRKSVFKKRVAPAAPRPSSGKTSTDTADRMSSRHVRFSMTSGTTSPSSYPSSPSMSSISPRLRKAREEFNAYLEAQGT